MPWHWTFTDPQWPDHPGRFDDLADMRRMMIRYPRITEAIFHFTQETAEGLRVRHITVPRAEIVEMRIGEDVYRRRLAEGMGGNSPPADE